METPQVLQLDFDFVQEVRNEPKKPSKRDRKNFTFDLMDVLQSPVIVFPTAWQNALPSDLIECIKEARMIAAMKNEDMATVPELVAYIMPRTFESPMDHHWTNIYTYAGAEYMRTFKRSNKADQIAPQELTEYETSMMNNLRRWIYKKRREALKKQLK